MDRGLLIIIFISVALLGGAAAFAVYETLRGVRERWRHRRHALQRGFEVVVPSTGLDQKRAGSSEDMGA